MLNTHVFQHSSHLLLLFSRKSCLSLCNSMDCSMPGSFLPLSFRVCSNLCPLIESVMLSNHLILCQPLLLLPSILPSIIVPSAFGHTGLVVHQTHQACSFLCSLSCCHFVSLNILHLYLHRAHPSLHSSLFSVESALRSLP